MPKDKSNRDYSSHKTRGYSYKPYSSHGKGPAASQGNSLDGEDSGSRKDWEDVTCPICMDSPHNAVLLLCSSHDKGCRPYMCDTSYRHSNCLDQYRKAHATAQKTNVNRESALENSSVEAADGRNTSSSDGADNNSSARIVHHSRSFHISGSSGHGTGSQRSAHEPEFLDEEGLEVSERVGTLELSGGMPRIRSSSPGVHEQVGLLCPLCRGKVKGWEVVKAARLCLNKKARGCAREACTFTGSYEELRAHARCEHPSARPADIDPARQRDWRRLERQRDLGDVLSTIRSAMPGGTVLGDYVIDGQDDDMDNDDSDFPGDEGHWWTVFLLFQVFGPTSSSFTGGRVIPSRFRGVVSSHHRTGGTRQGLWGENVQRSGSNGSNSSSGSSDTGELVTGSSRRRQRSQHRSQGNFS